MMGECKIIIYFLCERNKIVTYLPYLECTERNIGRRNKMLLERLRLSPGCYHLLIYA